MTLEEMISAVQKKLGIQVDGKAGPQTWTAVYAALVRPKAASLEAADLISEADPASEKRIAKLQPEVRPLARALIQKPKLLLLDEPTAGLDLLAREQVLATIQSLTADPKRAPTTILITHHVEELGPRTSHVVLLDNGQIAASGPPAEVLREETLSRVYRCPLTVQHEADRYYIRVDPAAWTGLVE